MFSTLPGYTGSNVQERPKDAEKNAQLTLEELERLIVRFIVDTYNQSIDARMGDQTRFQRWEAGLRANPEIISERELDICLMKQARRQVQRGGYIQFENINYISHFLGRVRRRNHLSASALGELAGIGGVIARWEKFRHNPFPSNEELTALGDLLGLELAQLKTMLPSEPMKLEPIRLCGACYSESPYHRIEWQYKSRWKCHKHDLKLLSKCPHCGAKFKIPSLWGFGKCDRCGLSLSECKDFQKIA